MTKPELLRFLAECDGASGYEVAQTFDLPYPAAAMALLRVSRQGLVVRRLDPVSGLLWYRLTAQGAARLAYFAADDHQN
jgi:DNA-binding MarR family transcriptional regulator